MIRAWLAERLSYGLRRGAAIDGDQAGTRGDDEAVRAVRAHGGECVWSFHNPFRPVPDVHLMFRGRDVISAVARLSQTARDRLGGYENEICNRGLVACFHGDRRRRRGLL